MPSFDLKITSTIIVRNVEAIDLADAEALIVDDLSTRFPANTEIVVDTTVVTEVLP